MVFPEQKTKKITRRGARTHDHKIKSLALYQTELGGRYISSLHWHNYIPCSSQNLQRVW